MSKTRLEAFSDGVIAVLITIMVLELKVPHGADLHAVRPLLPVFLSYVLSFVVIGIYWNNHHHMLHAAEGISGGMLWANLHLLFWLSLIPFTTAWMGENHVAALPTATYGLVLLCSGVARPAGNHFPAAAMAGPAQSTNEPGMIPSSSTATAVRIRAARVEGPLVGSRARSGSRKYIATTMRR